MVPHKCRQFLSVDLSDSHLQGALYICVNIEVLYLLDPHLLRMLC